MKKKIVFGGKNTIRWAIKAINKEIKNKNTHGIHWPACSSDGAAASETC
jgi:hypothetical protein